MDCCDPAVTRSWRLFRKRFIHIQENCSDFSPRLYLVGIMSFAIKDLPFTLQTLHSSVSNFTNNCPGRRSSISALLTVTAEPWLILVINLLDSFQHHLRILLMKLMWLGRISRPDIMVAINTLAHNITRWSANDDKRAARLVGYIAATVDYAPVMRINDPPAKLWLSLFFDSDFRSSWHKVEKWLCHRSWSPSFICFYSLGIKNPESQRAVFRSTAEAEFVALSILDLLCVKPVTAT